MVDPIGSLGGNVITALGGGRFSARNAAQSLASGRSEAACGLQGVRAIVARLAR